MNRTFCQVCAEHTHSTDTKRLACVWYSDRDYPKHQRRCAIGRHQTNRSTSLRNMIVLRWNQVLAMLIEIGQYVRQVEVMSQDHKFAAEISEGQSFFRGNQKWKRGRTEWKTRKSAFPRKIPNLDISAISAEITRWAASYFPGMNEINRFAGFTFQ